VFRVRGLEGHHPLAEMGEAEESKECWTDESADLLHGGQPSHGQNQYWQAHYIGKIVGANAAAIEASLTAWDTAANSADWNSVALSLRVQPQLHPQAEIDEITAGEIVFLGARAAYRMGLDLAPVDAQDMTTGQIESFVAGFD